MAVRPRASQLEAQAAQYPMVGGAHAVPDSLFKRLIAAIGLPAGTTTFQEQQGPYAGQSFDLASDPVKPGLSALGPAVQTATPFGIGGAITSLEDFLSYIAWIFYPLNILRAVEFLAGMLLFYLGIRPYLTQGSPSLASTGAGIQRVMRSIAAPTPLGRVSRERQGRRMGSREGQRESARMEARRVATRTERERSANERHRREQRAKRAARKTNP